MLFLYSRCLDLNKLLLLEKAVLLVNFAHLLLQNRPCDFRGGKKFFEPIYTTSFQKNKDQENLKL